METPDLTLSIVSHGQGQLMSRFLMELDKQPSLRGVRVIVTLNLATETFELPDLANLEMQVIRNTHPKGFGANHNTAFQHCGTGWFAVLNPDLRLNGSEPFSPLLHSAVLSSDTAIISPAVLSPDNRREDSVRTNLTLGSLLSRLKRKDTELDTFKPYLSCSRSNGQFFWLAGMCLLIRSGAYRAVGGFDERFHLYCEDYDLCARLWASGWKLTVDNSIGIIHDARRDSHRSGKHMRWHITSLLKVWMSRPFWIVTREIP